MYLYTIIIFIHNYLLFIHNFIFYTQIYVFILNLYSMYQETHQKEPPTYIVPETGMPVDPTVTQQI